MKGRITLITPLPPEPHEDQRLTGLEIKETSYTEEIPVGELQRLVGGYIELVPFWITAKIGATRVPARVLCNEDGKRLQLLRNHAATALWKEAIAADFGHRGTPQGDYLVGPVAIVTGDDEFMEAL